MSTASNVNFLIRNHQRSFTLLQTWGKPTAVAHGGNPQDRTGSRSWGGPPRPRYLAASPRLRCLPKTVMVRLQWSN
ncbi:hypothetical protein [Moorena producens]|uniref:hypothetical protein n=1 Tax=Moorena producens TaxID=1155739 RepID=UPI0011EA6307|nr:hypothetical protein [Moorena producens]